MLVLGSMNLSYADSTNVVTLGANLSESQKQQMLNYFGVKRPSLSFRCNKCRRKTVFTRCCNRGQLGKVTISCSYVEPTKKEMELMLKQQT